MYAKFGASCTKIDRGRRQKYKIWNEMRSATNRCAALMVFIIGIIIFMTVGKMEGDPATLKCSQNLMINSTNDA